MGQWKQDCPFCVKFVYIVKQWKNVKSVEFEVCGKEKVTKTIFFLYFCFPCFEEEIIVKKLIQRSYCVTRIFPPVVLLHVVLSIGPVPYITTLCKIILALFCCLGKLNMPLFLEILSNQCSGSGSTCFWASRIRIH